MDGEISSNTSDVCEEYTFDFASRMKREFCTNTMLIYININSLRISATKGKASCARWHIFKLVLVHVRACTLIFLTLL